VAARSRGMHCFGCGNRHTSTRLTTAQMKSPMDGPERPTAAIAHLDVVGLTVGGAPDGPMSPLMTKPCHEDAGSHVAASRQEMLRKWM